MYEDFDINDKDKGQDINKDKDDTLILNSDNDGYKQENTRDYHEIMAEIRPVRKKGFIKRVFNRYLAIALISSIVGGLVVSYAMPKINNGKLASTTILEPNYRPVTLNVNGGTDPWSLVAQIAKQISPAVVGISGNIKQNNVFGGQSQGTQTGSGIIISTDGYIITNNHVIQGADSITVKATTGKSYTAKVVGADETTDLAVLKIDAKNLPAAKLGDSSKVQVGELAVAVGNPLGDEFANSVTMGIISGVNRTLDTDQETLPLLQTDAAINPGNSGGPLVDSKGEVIGINSIKLMNAGDSSSLYGYNADSSSNVEGMGFAISINAAKPIIQELINSGKITRPMLGIEGATVTQDIADTYNLPVGVYVNQVISSASQQAGLKSKDVITAIDGKKVASIDDLRNIINTHKVGDTVKVSIIRNSEKLTLNIKLTQTN